VRIADGLILNSAQTKPLRGVIGRLLEPAVIAQQHFRLAVFEKKLAVVGALQATGKIAAGVVAIETGAIELGDGGGCHEEPRVVVYAKVVIRAALCEVGSAVPRRAASPAR